MHFECFVDWLRVSNHKIETIDIITIGAMSLSKPKKKIKNKNCKLTINVNLYSQAVSEKRTCYNAGRKNSIT